VPVQLNDVRGSVTLKSSQSPGTCTDHQSARLSALTSSSAAQGAGADGWNVALPRPGGFQL